MNTEHKSLNEMNIHDFKKVVVSQKKLYFTTCSIAIIIGLVVSFSIPKSYKSKVMLSPETSYSTKSFGNLGAITSMLGANINMGEDAINPQYYPNVLQSKKFLVSLFDIEVESIDGSIKTSLYDYCKNYQKEPWWSIQNPLKALSSKKQSEENNGKKMPTAYLTKEQSKIADMIKDMLTCNIDPKDGFITITATAQDPLISTELVDSVSNRLQQFIIEYRTSKARHDLNYIKKLYEEAEKKYKESRIRYARYSDSYSKVILKSYSTQEEELENQMQLDYNIYSQLAQQMQAAKGRVLERTPVFAVIEAATVPLKKDAPKRMLIMLAYFAIALMGTTAWILYKR